MGGQFVCSKVCVIMEVTMCDLLKEREVGRLIGELVTNDL